MAFSSALGLHLSKLRNLLVAARQANTDNIVIGGASTNGPADAIRWMQAHFIRKHGFTYWRAHSLCHGALL
uniref:hypothetical protein n=1 Tax=Rhizobium rhizoryzae TaxID=451876 RepID=UPI00289FA884